MYCLSCDIRSCIVFVVTYDRVLFYAVTYDFVLLMYYFIVCMLTDDLCSVIVCLPFSSKLARFRKRRLILSGFDLMPSLHFG